MKKRISLDVFISSPSDVNLEREHIENLVNKWNKDNTDQYNVILRPIKWESDLPASSASTPQPLINKELLESSDILIAVFWTRAGSPTDSYISGTVEEIERFLKVNKPVIMYFLSKEVNPTEIDTTQLSKVQKLRSRYGEILTYKIIKEGEIQDRLPRDLTHNVKMVTKGAYGRSKKVGTADAMGTLVEWWKVSISQLISQYLKDNNVAFAYKREITFQENCELMRSHVATHPDALRDVTKKAREYAFGLKYGRYNYKDDLRIVYTKRWFTPILEVLAEMPVTRKRVIGVGSNNGDELVEIFGNNPTFDIEVLDISKQAIDLGISRHKGFKFYVGDMESCPLKNQDYDIYLNLRSIHSSGVELKSALVECYRILKPGGFALFSISNGYLKKSDSNEKITLSGMYDTRTEKYSTEKPYRLAEKIREKLVDYEFDNIGVRTGLTEVFVWGQKSRNLPKI